jgi:Protein of unknown function (DUF3685)
MNKHRWRQLGLHQIERELQRLELLLTEDNLSVIDRLFWQGRRRELKAAAWVVQKTMPPETSLLVPISSTSLPVLAEPEDLVVTSSQNPVERLLGRWNDRDLENLTDRPLELDILRIQQRQRLLRSVVEQLQETLTELQGISPERLEALGINLLGDIWMGSAIRFYGRYYTLTVTGAERSVIETLAPEREYWQSQSLAAIPLSEELLGYLLCQQDMYIDNRLQAYGTVPAEAHVRDLLTNLLVRMANTVLAPFLNNFGELEPVKQQFYHPKLLATRDIARFRNHLSWQYYLDRQYRQPIAIFESRHPLLVLREGGLQEKSIYAPRRVELEKLRGWPWLVTMGLELRDGIAPLAKGVSTILGNVLVYVLTEIVGRGLGLVGKGILQGLGQALQEKR